MTCIESQGACARDNLADVPMGGHSVEPLLLVEEITHRVVNEYAAAIAAINLEAMRAADVETRTALRRTTDRLHAFAEAHRALQAPIASGDILLGDYLDRVFSTLSEASLRDRGIRLLLVEDDIVMLTAQRGWRVALIIAELITNSVRHAIKASGGAIVVEILRLGQEVVCVVADSNGGCTPNPMFSRGGKVVERLARELGGEIRWRFGPAGVTVTLTFPAFEGLADADLGGTFLSRSLSRP